VLEESGISVAPPPRSHLAKTTALPGLPTRFSTRQRRSDPPADTNNNRSNEAETTSSDTDHSDTSKSATSKSKGNASGADDNKEHQTDEHKSGLTAGMFIYYNALSLSILTFL
jgi:hypothetical protein